MIRRLPVSYTHLDVYKRQPPEHRISGYFQCAFQGLQCLSLKHPGFPQKADLLERLHCTLTLLQSPLILQHPVSYTHLLFASNLQARFSCRESDFLLALEVYTPFRAKSRGKSSPRLQKIIYLGLQPSPNTFIILFLSFCIKSTKSRKCSCGSQFFLNPEQLIVLGNSFTSAWSTCLDLAGI